MIVLLSVLCVMLCILDLFFFFQAEDGIRDLVRSRGLGDVYKRQAFVFYAVIVASAVGTLSEVFGDLQRAAGATERLLSLIHI